MALATKRTAPASVYRSTVGRKAIMAVTGGILVLFLLGHMAGNLKIFLGAADYNGYASWLRHAGDPALPYRAMLTATEVVLTVSVILHMWAAVTLARRAQRARPVKYVARPASHADRYAVHTMRYGGVLIAVFVIWHILDLTLGVVNPRGGATPYAKVVADFDPSRWYITLFYLVAVVMVGLHLRHGVASAFQTLGLSGGRRTARLNLLAGVVSALLVVGFSAVPIAVTAGLVK